MKTMFGKRYPNCVKKEEVEQVGEGVLDAALETDKKMGELHKKVDNDVKRMKAGKKFKEEVEQIDELINPKINLPFSGDKIVYGGGFGSTLGVLQQQGFPEQQVLLMV